MDSIYAWLRKRLELTQQEVVAKYNENEGFNVAPMLSEQFLRRLEQGTVSDNDHEHVTLFWNVYLNTYHDRLSILIEYRDLLLSRAAALNCPVLPIDTQAPNITACYESWFIVERYALRRHSGAVAGDNAKKLITAVTQKYDKPNTVYAFCRLLKLHPFVVQRWVKQSGDAIMPVGVRTALEQAGWTII